MGQHHNPDIYRSGINCTSATPTPQSLLAMPMMLLPTPTTRRHRRRHKVEVVDAALALSSTTTATIAATAKAMLLAAMILLAVVTATTSSSSTSTTSSIIPPATTTTVVACYCATGPFTASLKRRRHHHQQRYTQHQHTPQAQSSKFKQNSQQQQGWRRRQASQPFFNYPTASTATTRTIPSILPSPSSLKLMTASVPPPNSRLGRNLLLRQQMQHQHRSSTPPVGGSRNSRAASRGKSEMGGRSRLSSGINHPRREYFSTYGSIYARYCSVGFNGDEDITLDGIHSNNGDEDGEHTCDTGNEKGNENAMQHADKRQHHSAPMIRFMDNGSRLNCPRRRRHYHGGQRSSNIRSSRRHRRKDSSSLSSQPSASRLDYERRKAEWAAKYTSVSTLRKSFGSNKNRFWGDFDPVTTRKLYHTLLPRALLELRGLRDGLVKSSSLTSVTSSTSSEDSTKEDATHSKEDKRQLLPWRRLKLDDDDKIDNNTYLKQELKELAPLAYRARLAAKEYARERCILPARIGSMLYDGYRSWRRYGKWNRLGMTWEQIWNKYEDQVLREAQQASLGSEVGEMLEGGVSADASTVAFASSSSDGSSMREDEELTARICLRILERSVVTNEAIDRLFLKSIAVEDVHKLEILTSNRPDISSATDGKLDEKRQRQRRQHQQQRRRKLVRQLRRKLQIQADLQAIEKKFDDDIRELLRFSNLASKEGEERRNRRRGGVFFWKKSTESDHDENSVPGTPIPIIGATLSNKLESDGGDAQSTSAMAATDFALRGRTTDTSVLSDENSTNEDTNMYSMSETTVTTKLAGSEVGTEQRSDVVKNIEDEKQSSSIRKLAVHEVIALRTLAMTKQRIASLQASPQLGGDDADSEV